MPEAPKPTTPIQAKDAKKPAAAPAAAGKQLAGSPAPDLQNKKTGLPLAKKPSAAATIKKGPSPIKAQHHDTRGQAAATPVSITFIGGRFDGETLDLGVAIAEISTQQNNEWESQKGDRIRPGVNFKGIGLRDFSLSAVFYDTTHDVSHLAESLAHTQEIGDGDLTPPYLMIKSGDLVAAPVYCTSYSAKYKEPFTGSKGFHYAEVEMSFQMAGGQVSEHVLGKPLTSTPLEDARAKRTEKEQQKIAQKKKVDLILAPCLNNREGADQLKRMMEADQTAKVSEIMKLPPDVLVQAAIGGVFPKKAFDDPVLQLKLKDALATEMANWEDGVRNTIHVRRFANVLKGDRIGVLPAELQGQAEMAKVDFESIYKGVVTQTFDSGSGGFMGLGGTSSPLAASGSTARFRLTRFGQCGLSLRQANSQAIASSEAGAESESGKTEAKTLKEINEMIALGGSAGLSDKDLMAAFGLKTSTQLKSLRNGAPYSSRDEFVNHASRTAFGISGFAMWANFEQSQKNKEAAKNKKDKK